MSGSVNFTTKYSQINSIQRDIMLLKQQISQLSNKFARYNKLMTDLIEGNVIPSSSSKSSRRSTDETSNLSENITFRKKGLTEIKGDIIMSGNIISENINNLSANVDVMLGQMLEAQRQLTEANTITITRQMKPQDISFSISDELDLVIDFKRLPVGLNDSLTFSIEGLTQPLIVFFDFAHHSTHTNHPAYHSFITKKESLTPDELPVYRITVELGQNVEQSHAVTLIQSNVRTRYEFDQDELISQIVNHIDNNDKTFFETLLVNINEIKN